MLDRLMQLLWPRGKAPYATLREVIPDDVLGALHELAVTWIEAEREPAHFPKSVAMQAKADTLHACGRELIALLERAR